MSISYTAGGNATTIDPKALDQAGISAVEGALSAWAEGKDGIIVRFSTVAFAKYGYTPRTLKYRKKQQSKLGFVAPFTSPIKGRPNKFRDVIRVPDVGHRVKVGAVSGKAVGYLTARAARGLNFHPRFLHEWSTLHPIEEKQIIESMEQRMSDQAERVLNG